MLNNKNNLWQFRWSDREMKCEHGIKIIHHNSLIIVSIRCFFAEFSIKPIKFFAIGFYDFNLLLWWKQNSIKYAMFTRVYLDNFLLKYASKEHLTTIVFLTVSGRAKPWWLCKLIWSTTSLPFMNALKFKKQPLYRSARNQIYVANFHQI